MADTTSGPQIFRHRLAVFFVVAVGIAVAAVSFFEGRAEERERAETQFARRAEVRHNVTRELLARYQDLLFTLRTMFAIESKVARNTFVRATRWLEGSYTGVQALEWVPAVPAEARDEVEAATAQASGQPFEFKELGPDGNLVRAAPRPVHYPIVYVHPVPGNEAAWGYDLQSGPTLGFLERARIERRMIVTGQVRLVQETGNLFGFVMIWPVFRRAEATVGPGAFLGFVQAVLKTHQVIGTTLSRQPENDFDMMFIDAGERDPAKRLLYYRPAGLASREAAVRPPDESEFHSGFHRELILPLGGRDWRVLYRPTDQWLKEQSTSVPWMRSGSILVITALLAGLIHTLGRRTEIISRTVAERTAELTESRREFDSFFSSLPGMAYRGTHDPRFHISYVSAGSLALTGYPAEDFVSGKIHLRDIIHPDDLPGVRRRTLAAIAAGQTAEVEYRIRTRDGPEKWILSRGHSTRFKSQGLPVFEGLAIDITDRKNAEQDRLLMERKLLESQKLESLGLLAGGIAHDFNNLLTGILGNANLARLTLPAGSSVVPRLRAIETASHRAAELCRQMLAYAGKGRFVVEPVDLGQLSSGLVPLLEVSIAHKSTLRLALAPSLPAVLADATQLRQIVMNLVLNAADAVSGRPGEIALVTGVVHADRAFLKSCVTGADLPPGDFVFLDVTDNGCGMSPEVVAKIFDPFYTTKFAGRGLGLAAVLGIVRGHHGALHVASRPGHGTTFRLLLPSGQPGTVAAPSAAAPSTGWQQTGRILVIDDEEGVRCVVAAVLQTFGFTPVTADDGPAGIAAFRAGPADFQAVLLDVLMPGLSGEETLAELRLLRPAVPVLLMSGYNEGDLLRRLARPGSPLAFLQKPFTRDELAQSLRPLLV